MPRCPVTLQCQIEEVPLLMNRPPGSHCHVSHPTHYFFLKTTSAILKWLKFCFEYKILQNSQCALRTFCLHICPPASLTCLPSLSAQSTPQHHVGKKLPAMQIVKIMHLEVYIHSTLNNLDPYFLCTCQGKLFSLSPFSAYLKYLFCIL